MTVEQVKASILQLAIQGKLVPQDPNDEPASELLKRIEAAKNAKAAKKRKPLPPIKDDEKPFSIPDSWEWVRLMDIAKVITGNTPNKITTTFYGGNYKFFKPADLDAGYNVYVASDSLSESGRKISRQLPKDSVLVTCIGATIGKAGIIRDEGTCNQQINALIPVLVLSEYIYFAVISDWFQNRMWTLSGKTTLPILNKSAFQQMLLPLPPLAEQKRIVAKVEALFKYVDECEDSRRQLAENLAETLKRSVLQEAIQGRLVAQDPNDEPASELLKRIEVERENQIAAKKIKKPKPLPPITDDEKPFDIPDSWEWVRLGGVSEVIRGSGIMRSDTVSKGVQCVRYGEIYTTYGFSFEHTKSFVSERVAGNCHEIVSGDVLCTLTGECKEEIAKATAFLGTKRAVIGGDLAKITNHHFEPLLLVYFFFSPFMILQKAAKSNGDIIVHIGKNAIESLLIPLPPLAEQKRIVAKVDSLLAGIRAVRNLDPNISG